MRHKISIKTELQNIARNSLLVFGLRTFVYLAHKEFMSRVAPSSPAKARAGANLYLGGIYGIVIDKPSQLGSGFAFRGCAVDSDDVTRLARGAAACDARAFRGQHFGYEMSGGEEEEGRAPGKNETRCVIFVMTSIKNNKPY